MKRPTAIILKAAGTLLAMLILYVLSFGPIYGYVVHSFAKRLDMIAENRLRLAGTAYAPILWIANRNQTIEQIGSTYVFFFVEKIYAPKKNPNDLLPKIVESN